VPTVDTHDVVNRGSVSQHQVIWIHTRRIAAGVYDHFVGTNLTIPFDASSHSVCCGHYLLIRHHTPRTHEAIALAMTGACVFDTASGHDLLLVVPSIKVNQ
jgi:hypothetical protein